MDHGDHGDHGDMVAVKKIGKSMTNRLTQHDLTIVIESASFFLGEVQCRICKLCIFKDFLYVDYVC